MAPLGAAAATDSVSITRSAAATIYEARLSASDLGLSSFGAGDSFGSAWIVNEMDGSGLSEGFIEWTSGIGVIKDPSAFGDLVLRNCD
jgi:hypothetical protein